MSLSSQNPTIVLIRGAWLDPPIYQKFQTALNTLGPEVYIPRLPTLNDSRPPNGDLYSDTHLIRNYVTSLVDAGREVTVLMHSYGG
ncbi:alpha/beta hydrolase [Aspergillus affinis]|uniref:alpha/beta hydrolase n=1 Tax=Aspergillus affinis TaxID=1070780 RepID=UPI0022FEC150|nr:uncharacterized protein KD926_004263 [Aspergillus affinis]KAI9035230.1 hypothetical protein KD926_004263 [Aspergillus affinis]